MLRELSVYPLLLSSVFVPTSVLIHVSVPDNKGVPRAPISQGITLLDNSPEFPPKLDQTQLILLRLFLSAIEKPFFSKYKYVISVNKKDLN